MTHVVVVSIASQGTSQVVSKPSIFEGVHDDANYQVVSANVADSGSHGGSGAERRRALGANDDGGGASDRQDGGDGGRSEEG